MFGMFQPCSKHVQSMFTHVQNVLKAETYKEHARTCWTCWTWL